jgi:hypothetical protein
VRLQCFILFAAVVAGCFQITEPAHRFRARRLCSQALAAQFVDAHLEMRAQFLVDLGPYA